MKPSEHLRFVDGLRACAILAVIGVHSWKNSAAHDAPYLRLAALGGHGVELFFVISGLCLSYPFLANRAKAFDWHTYMARRLVRIFPIFWAALALFTVIAWATRWTTLGNEPGYAAAHYTLGSTIREALLFDGGPLHNMSFWTLGIEFRWYFVFPVALWLYMRSPRAIVALGLGAWALAEWSKIQGFDVTLFPAFLMGIIAADLLLQQPVWLRWAPVAFCAALAIALADEPHWANQGPLWQTVCFLFVLSVIATPALRRLLGTAPIVAVGLASYSIYLVHEPFIAWLQPYDLSPIVPFSLALALGFALWAIVERPLLEPHRRARMTAFVRNALLLASTLKLADVRRTLYKSENVAFGSPIPEPPVKSGIVTDMPTPGMLAAAPAPQ